MALNDTVLPKEQIFGDYWSHYCLFKGRVHCFSMQIVINKCFLLNPEKKFGADPPAVFVENAKNAHFNSEKW